MRLWDLAYAMKGFVPLVSGGDPVADAPRLRALADGYGLSAGQRAELPPLIGAHTRGMADLLDNGDGFAVAFAEPPKLPEPTLRWGSWSQPRQRWGRRPRRRRAVAANR